MPDDLELKSLVLQLAVVAGGVFALHVFYRAVQTNWPQSYMSVSDFTGQLVSTSLSRYTAYRVLPVFAVTFFIAGSLRASNEPFTVAPLAVALIHGGATNGVAGWATLRSAKRPFGFLSNLVFHSVAAIGTAIAGLCGVIAARSDDALLVLPSPRELSASLWTAVAAALLGAYIVKLSASSGGDPLQKARATIPGHLWIASREYALRNETDPSIVKAIMVVENMQRPRWLRRLESLKGRLGLSGTYGIMQVTSEGYLDDESSLRRACEEHLKGVRPPRDQRGHPDWDAVRAAARRHNEDPAFVELVASAFWQIEAEEALLRARITFVPTHEGAKISNEGGGPAKSLFVYRIQSDGSEVAFGRVQLERLDPGADTTLSDFTPASHEAMPNTSRWEIPEFTADDWLLRATWQNDDSTPGDTDWIAISRHPAATEEPSSRGTADF